MSILVIGRSGQVASALVRCAAEENIELQSIGRPELDLTNADAVAVTLGRTQPKLVINAAAYTAVDQAEEERAAAFDLNAAGPQHLAEQTAEMGIPLIHYSTDYVFSGDQETAYLEDDPTGPSGVYGESKLLGEQKIAAANPAHIIMRTAWVFDRTGKNFPRTMLRLASDRDAISVVSDQMGNPTDALEIARASLQAAKAILAGDAKQSWGIYHFAGPQSVSWAQFARLIFKVSQAHGGPSAAVNDITTSEYPTPAKRPANSMLSSARFTAAFGYEHIELEAALNRCMPHWLADT